jgi:hypothetical protein
MSVWSNITDFFNKPLDPVPSGNNTMSDFTTIAAALAYMKPLGTELIAFEKAWNDKSTEEELLAGIPLIAMMVKVLSIAFPQIALVADGVSIAAFIAPILVEILMKTGSKLVPDGQGGWVTQEWIDNPRHKLNPDGTFVDKNWL